MIKPLSGFAALAIAMVILLPVPSMAQGRDRTRIGTLACDISAGIALIMTSKQNLTCMYMPAKPGPREVYTGLIIKFGLDMGATSRGEMIWSVFAPNTRKFGALSGQYGGASAEATLGAGVGANVLVGGSDRTISLQPLSMQGQTGLNFAVGVAGLELHPAR